jgi:protein-S-isoprenylcysteine O-methyltransferase Ste14
LSHYLLIAVVLIWVPLLSMRIALHVFGPLWKRLGDVSFAISLAHFAVLMTALWWTRGRWMPWRIESFPFALPLGIFFLGFGVLFGLWTIRTLGLPVFLTRPQLSPDKSASRLIARGPFAIVRHPFYFSEWFVLLGAVLITRSPAVLFLLVAALAVDPAVSVLEEKELVARLGNDYVAYQKRVPRLLPDFKRRRIGG